MNKQNSGVEVVRGCLTEGGDTIIYRCLLLRALASEATRQVTSFLASYRILSNYSAKNINLRVGLALKLE